MLAHSYYPDHLWDNDQRVELKDNVLEVQYGKGTYSQDLIHSKALDYLDNLKEDEPFFMWYPTILPHAELIVPEDSIIKKFRGMYPEKAYKGTEPGSPAFRKGGYCTQLHPHATFAAMIYRLDVYVGQIVQKLKDKGLYDNTIIFSPATTVRTWKVALILISSTATVCTVATNVTYMKAVSACR